MSGLESDLEELYRRRQGAFQVMLAAVTGSIESARDVVQEAFAQALRDQDAFRGEGSLEGSVWRIAFRVAIGSKGSRELAVDELPEVAFVDETSDPTLASAVRELPPQRRMAIFLRHFARSQVLSTGLFSEDLALVGDLEGWGAIRARNGGRLVTVRWTYPFRGNNIRTAATPGQVRSILRLGDPAASLPASA